MLTIKESVSQLLEHIRLRIITEQEDKKIRASGASAKSLRSKVKEVSGNINGTLTGKDYFYFQENGRSAGTLPPVDSIKKWIKAKGIQPKDGKVDSLAWAIAMKIKKSGTRAKRNEGPRLEYTTIVKESVEEKRGEIKKAMFNQFRTEVGKVLKTSLE